jgi:hypothetical protein
MGQITPKESEVKKKRRTRKEVLEFYIQRQKDDALKTLGVKEYLRRYEPVKYRQMMDRGA